MGTERLIQRQWSPRGGAPAHVDLAPSAQNYRARPRQVRVVEAAHRRCICRLPFSDFVIGAALGFREQAYAN